MPCQMTYMERLTYELEARAAERVERSFETRLRLAKTPADKVAAAEHAEAVYRLERFDRCFYQARKKIKAGKQLAEMHIHERQALQDAADFDGVSVQKIIEARKT